MSASFNRVAAQSPALDAGRIGRLSDDELGARAQSIALAAPADSAVVRFGALAFWTVVLCLLAVRALVVDPASLRPSISAAQPGLVAAELVASRI